MLHARHDLLADEAAFLETYAAHLVEQHVVWEGVSQRIVGAAFGDAIVDAERVPVDLGGARRGGGAVMAEDRLLEAAVADS